MFPPMVSEKTLMPLGSDVSSGFDRQSAEAAQAEPSWPTNTPTRSRLRLRTLVTLRWWFLLGQTALLITISQGLHFDAPYGFCAALVGLSCWVNLLTGVASPGQRMTTPWEATAQLTLDILQITGLLYLLFHKIHSHSGKGPHQKNDSDKYRQDNLLLHGYDHDKHPGS